MNSNITMVRGSSTSSTCAPLVTYVSGRTHYTNPLAPKVHLAVREDCKLEVAHNIIDSPDVYDKPETEKTSNSVILTFKKSETEFAQVIFYNDKTIKGILRITRQGTEAKAVGGMLDPKNPVLTIAFGKELWAVSCGDDNL